MQARTFAAIALAAAPALALAHPGHAALAAGLVDGFTHPFTGADHLAAMLAVGLWSAVTLPHRRWLAPLAFAAMLLAGAVLAPQRMPFVEGGIAASLLVFGLAVAARVPLPALAGALVVGAFALFHGAAHGNELRSGAALAGMVAATALLHATGLALGVVLRERSRWLTAAIGGGVALIGAAALLA
jgi:urease accessory protein